MQTILDQNLVATIIMTMSSYLQNVVICTHCTRSIEWILAAGKDTVCKMLWDEGVFPLACDILKNHVDSTLLGYICSMLSKLIRMSQYDAHCISEIQNSGLFLLIEESIQRNFKSESTLSALLNLLAVLISNRFSFERAFHPETTAKLLLETDLCALLVKTAATVQLDTSIALLTGILWKVSLYGMPKIVPIFVIPRIGPKTDHELRSGGRGAERAAALPDARDHSAEHNWNTVPAVVVL